MKQIPVDWLAPRKRFPLGALLLLLLGLAGAAASFERHRHWRGQADTVEAQLQELRQTTRRAATRVREPARAQAVVQQEVRAANRTISQLNIPWPALFRDLESATDRSVSLLAIQPDANTGSVRLEGEAQDYKALLRFVGKLEATAAFSTVHVASHQTRLEARARPIAFALVASWSADPL